MRRSVSSRSSSGRSSGAIASRASHPSRKASSGRSSTRRISSKSSHASGSPGEAAADRRKCAFRLGRQPQGQAGPALAEIASLAVAPEPALIRRQSPSARPQSPARLAASARARSRPPSSSPRDLISRTSAHAPGQHQRPGP